MREEIEEVHSKTVAKDQKLINLETQQGVVDARMDAMEERLHIQHQRLIRLQLQTEDSENRSRRNNVRIRVIPEAVAGSGLRDSVTVIFNQLLENPPDTLIELDRVHMVPTARNPDQSTPRDVLCRVHFFRIREDIIRAAWQKGPLDFEEVEIQVYPNLCRQTKNRRHLLKPLLDHLRSRGATYQSGYPLSLYIKKDERSFNLYDPPQLPDLFYFLGSEAIEEPNRTDLPTLGERDPQQQLRSQWRGRSRSGRPCSWSNRQASEDRET